ncbi:tetratricopeptide repeat protein [Rhodoblastus acidophilus]|uniref:Tetratricopeptide repeat protein n=1 Tax=Candidatus Rhodoblastus alkanivorans TaxID=2954117 RepID=A0ABS9Z8U8_9HYPH|nr:tetratricopeptide repeat protein [Candidatus Rhodoblastus alkanivorans]MCI4679325.1 tetratricopeptide repeat protein [Candidatus Rhodoblastus alkanivorans]MCI4684048.1 tetratricopeptide repeat protein [Candidatus Rhodoblastus alkanivorans]MDI4641368.1 tetratricopeptide repeat protein [Rhodoblastus acidophilus]
MRLFILSVTLLVLVLAPARAKDTAAFVGSESCAACHRAQYEDWRKSHHAGAMQIADEKNVLGDFNDAHFRKGSIETTFFRRDGKYFVRTDGPDGKLADFEIKYTFGLSPLQQYLIELPGGRLQAFGIAWDSRPKEHGGQKWFDLYPNRELAAGDPLHWTGIDQNWNYQCAWCHSTDLKKNYDPTKDTFATHWSEISIGCEACHGPASRHLAWAKGGAGLTPDEKKAHGFAFRFDQRKGVTWTPNPQGTAARSQPPGARTEELVCAGCHSRRGQFADAPQDVHHFYDAFRPATLAPGLYYPDGQQREEVYNFASFAQSRMHAAGVTCSDCHNPHSGKLRLPGNQVCGQCHAAKVFDTPAHHHHPQGSPGAQCAACHMPTTNYMVIHARQDHSIRIPRPDRTISMGTPNACNKCHADEDANWAEAALKGWGMTNNPGAQTFAEAFALADADGPGATGALLGVANDSGQSSIARASALARLDGDAAPAVIEAAAQLTKADDPMIRVAAAEVLANADSAAKARALAPLLRDPTRLVRMQAARSLAGAGEANLAPGDLVAFEKALDEYVAGEMFTAERPESRANLGALDLARGKIDAAQAEFAKALALDKTFAPAAIQLAEIARHRGDEPGAEAILAKALADNPRSGPLAHALGLSLIRQKRTAEAVAKLELATKLAPDNAHYAYVYAVALHDTGEPAKAREVLRAALARRPNDREILAALASYEAQEGDYASALGHVQALQKLEPDNPRIQGFADALRAKLVRPEQ